MGGRESRGEGVYENRLSRVFNVLGFGTTFAPGSSDTGIVREQSPVEGLANGSGYSVARVLACASWDSRPNGTDPIPVIDKK